MNPSTGLEKIKLFEASALRKLANYHLGIFYNRVTGGYDAKGKRFKPYTKEYTKMKIRGMEKLTGKGRRKGYEGISLSRQISPPDFRLRGKTLENNRVKKIEKDFYTIGFTGDYSDIVKGNEERGRDIWTDIPNKEKDKLCNMLVGIINDEIKSKIKNVTINLG